ncbi:leucine-rich repeat protein 1 isoform X3 [Harpegnathos saltator]|uniref:leucine-rich repeat protein 1 isoform X3 n=1 Tax=Harpegnathos saltator TaxID=610380 RepID=UPI0005911400|nr:leucine-rich repeat protein 1 isoform X3 [Harpegnathos saltator]
MKLHCNVEVHNRALLSMSQRKSQRSVLTIGKQSDKDDLYIFLQTLQNKKGTKYKEVGCMPHLRELLISQNHLGRSQSKWKWIDQAAIKKNLHLLDISSNVISELPVQIGALDALVKLQIYQNLLKNLPQSIGRLRNLKHLEAARNCLSHLPGSMRNLQLDYLDLSSNPFLVYRRNTLYRHMHMTASLVECAAVAFLKTRIPYDAGMLPRTLVQYLDNATYCSVCANGCFNRFIMGYLEIELRRISCQTKITANATILFECYFCSNKCIRYF